MESGEKGETANEEGEEVENEEDGAEKKEKAVKREGELTLSTSFPPFPSPLPSSPLPNRF